MPNNTQFAGMNYAMDDPRWTFNAMVNSALARGVTPEELNQGTSRTARSPKGNDITVTDLNSLGIWGQGAMDPQTRKQVNEEVQSLARKSRRKGRTTAAAIAAAAAGGAALAGGAGSGGAAGAAGSGAGGAGGAGSLSTVALPANAVPITAGAAGAAGGSSMAAWIPAAISAGTSLLSGFTQSGAADDAAEAQRQGSAAAIDYSRESRDLALRQQEPFLQSAHGALGGMLDMLGLDRPHALKQAMQQGQAPTADTVPEYLAGHGGSPLSRADFESVSQLWPTIREAADYSHISQQHRPNISPEAQDALAGNWGTIREAANFGDINWENLGYSAPSSYEYDDSLSRWDEVYGRADGGKVYRAAGGPTYLMGEAGKEDYYQNGSFSTVHRPRYVEGQDGYVIPRDDGGPVVRDPRVGPADEETRRAMIMAKLQEAQEYESPYPEEEKYIGEARKPSASDIPVGSGLLSLIKKILEGRDDQIDSAVNSVVEGREHGGPTYRYFGGALTDMQSYLGTQDWQNAGQSNNVTSVPAQEQTSPGAFKAAQGPSSGKISGSGFGVPGTGSPPNTDPKQPGTTQPVSDTYDIRQDPSYQFRLDESMRALESSAAAKGGLMSGGFGRKALRMASDFASTEYGNIFNRLGTIAGYGPSATANAGTASMNFGNQAGQAIQNAGMANASAYTARGNIHGQMIQDIGGIDWQSIFNQDNQG